MQLERCHVLAAMQHAVRRIITLLVRLSCRYCTGLGALAVDYLSESCILGFVSTSQICCGDGFDAEGIMVKSVHTCFFDMIVGALHCGWFFRKALCLALHGEIFHY